MAIINSIISGGGGGGSPWTFYKNVYSKDYTLAETDYATWTPSGTASVIISDVIGYSSESLDLTNKEYLIKKTITIDFVYLAGATMKSAPIQYIFHPHPMRSHLHNQRKTTRKGDEQ